MNLTFVCTISWFDVLRVDVKKHLDENSGKNNTMLGEAKDMLLSRFTIAKSFILNAFFFLLKLS